MKKQLFILVIALICSAGLTAQIKKVKPLASSNANHALSVNKTNQYDFFIKIEGVDGESKDSKHRDWINIEAFNFNLNTSLTQTGRVTGHNSMGMVLQKFPDISSVAILQKINTNSIIPEMLLEVTNKSGKKSVITKYELSNVRFSKFEVETLKPSQLLETINVLFERVTITSYQYDRSGNFVSKNEIEIAPNSMY